MEIILHIAHTNSRKIGAGIFKQNAGVGFCPINVILWDGVNPSRPGFLAVDR